MTLLQISFSGMVLILVIAVIRAAMLHYLPKRTFLILWSVAILRLLIPFSIPSKFSIYSLAEQVGMLESVKWVGKGAAAVQSEVIYEFQNEVAFMLQNRARSDQKEPIANPSEQMLHLSEQHYEQIEPNIWQEQNLSPNIFWRFSQSQRDFSICRIIYIFGTFAIAAFFLFLYLRCRWDVQTSLPVDAEFAKKWLKEHPMHRLVTIRQSDRVTVPMTCGIFRPVILMPRDIDWQKEEQLSYVLLHEAIHIRYFDQVLKLFLMAALCIHWFNPAVWVMHLFCSRDIELACDECVVRQSGKDIRSAYAYTLLSMAEEKNELLFAGSSFGRNAIEERIRAIMKAKEKSVFAILLAMLLVIGIAAIFSTSAKAEDKKDFLTTIPGDDFTEEESQRLFALWIDDYEDMTVADYQKQMWTMWDNPEDIELIGRFSQLDLAYEMEDSKEAEALDGFFDYFFHIYEPLTAERWQSRNFSGYAMTNFPEAFDQANFEYNFTLTILDADCLIVGAYYQAWASMDEGLHHLLDDIPEEKLTDEQEMYEYLQNQIDALTEQYENANLSIQVTDWVYMRLNKASDDIEMGISVPKYVDKEEMETREYPNGTQEDYASLLELMTPDYKNMSLADFNMRLLDWANENFERSERIAIDTAWNDYLVSLKDAEKEFVETTVLLSSLENSKMVQSHYTRRPEEDPIIGGKQLEKEVEEDGLTAWCQMYYQFSYHILDKNVVTVAKRDQCVGGMIERIQTFWDETDIEELLTMTETDIVSMLGKLADECSSEYITISINKDGVGFESMDERGIEHRM